MKKLATIIYLASFMLSFAELGQFLKIPSFIGHYKEHKLADQHLTLLDFIQIHYLGAIEVDDDYQQDQKLPFRDADNLAISTSLSFEALPFSMDIEPLQQIMPQFSIYNGMNKALITSCDFFQPPRLT